LTASVDQAVALLIMAVASRNDIRLDAVSKSPLLNAVAAD
jgi:hypothetical protein